MMTEGIVHQIATASVAFDQLSEEIAIRWWGLQLQIAASLDGIAFNATVEISKALDQHSNWIA